MSIAIKQGRMAAVTRRGFQGDPGLLGFIGGAVRKVSGLVANTGLPGISQVGSVVNRVLTPTRPQIGTPPPPSFQVPGVGGRGGATRTTTGVQLPGGVVIGRRTESLGGQLNIGPAGMGGPGTEMVVANGTGCPKGFRPNKTSYFLKSGEFVPAGSRCVRVRKRNPLNAKAFDRSVSRIVAFKKRTERAGRVTVRKPKALTSAPRRRALPPARAECSCR